MSYYGMGDYYMGQGDPGLFGSLGRIFGGVAKGVVGTVLGSTPVGAVARAGYQAFRGGSRQAPPKPQIKMGPITYAQAPAQRKGPAYDAPSLPMGPMTADTKGFKKRRRMNVANPKALRRAIRRESGFVKLARRALKGTGYTVVSRASRSRKVNIREAGPGSVTVQR